MNILLVGKGWVGKKMFVELTGRGHNVSFVSHNDAVNLLKIDQLFDWVINCAGVTGYPNVDACELNKKETIEGNSVYPILLYEAVKSTNARFAHFSSGCVYEGLIEKVDAEPNYFGSIYSVSKGISDSYLIDKAVVYRIRMPFTPTGEHKNYLTKVYNYSKKAKLIEGGNNSITDLNEAVVVACNILERDEPNGAYNLVNSGSVTMHDIAQLMGITAEWFTSEEFSKATLAKRSNCVIPAYHEMSDVRIALSRAIKPLKIQLNIK